MSRHDPKPPLWKSALLFFSFTASFSIVLQNALYVAIALWAQKERPRLWIPRFKNAFSLATLLLLASILLSAWLGVNPSESLKTTHKYLTLLALFPIAAMSLALKERSQTLKAFVLGTAICGLWGILKHVAGNEDRISSFSGHYMVFGGLLMVASLCGVHFLVQKPKARLMWLATGINLVALWLTQTRGAWLGFAAGLLGMCLFSRRRALLLVPLLLGAGFFLAPSSGRDRVWDLLQRNERWSRSSDMERVLIWKAGLRILKDHPVFGIGQGNLEVVYPAYKERKATEKTVGHMHNNFLQLAVQNGLVGLAAYLFWIAAFYWMAFRSRPPDPETRALNLTLTWLFTAVLVWGLTEYTFSHQFMAVQALLLGTQWGLSPGAEETDSVESRGSGQVL